MNPWVGSVCLVTLICLSVITTAVESAPRWRIGEPIVTYWCGPGTTMPADPLTASQLRSGGWNLAWTDNEADLDLYHRYGLRVMLVINTPDVDDPAQAGSLLQRIQQVRSHPALYAYYLVDEPGAGAFPRLGRLVAFLRKHDPAHLAYINLLPTYASDGQLNVTDDDVARARVGYPTNFAGVATDDFTTSRYVEHLRQYVQVVQPDLISYDHYHFLRHGDGAQYFLNLGLIRKAALKAGVPFLNIIQSCDSPAEGWRGPGEHEIRWLTYTSLAYGAQGLAHFRYDIGFWTNPKDQTTLQSLFWSVAQSNREFVAIARQLQQLKSLGAYHTGELPLGAEPMPADCAFRPEPSKAGVLIGLFGAPRGRATHAIVVNLDYRQSRQITVTGPKRIDVYHPGTDTWVRYRASARIELLLPPGGGVLVREGR